MLFTKPENLNGTQLIAELSAVGLSVDRVTVEASGELFLDVPSKNKAKAEAVIAAHNGSTVAPEPSISEKLASVGLSIEELKAALLA
jgi:hypothetical protein